LRGALLMPLCTLAVHQLRFYLSFGSHAPAVLAREGHGYLQFAEPAVVLVAALGVGWFVGSVCPSGIGSSCPSGIGSSCPSGIGSSVAHRTRWATRCAELPGRSGTARFWLVCALLLFAIYCGQELLEGFLLPGHPAGIAGVLGQGGWTAAPISLLIAAALAIALRAADRLLEAVRGGAGPRWARAANDIVAHSEPRTADWRLDPRAGVVAGRAPPRAVAPLQI
jgi:hypothetical protein